MKRRSKPSSASLSGDPIPNGGGGGGGASGFVVIASAKDTPGGHEQEHDLGREATCG